MTVVQHPWCRGFQGQAEIGVVVLICDVSLKHARVFCQEFSISPRQKLRNLIAQGQQATGSQPDDGQALFCEGQHVINMPMGLTAGFIHKPRRYKGATAT